MTDTYQRIMGAPVLGGAAKRVGLPKPPALRRWRDGAPTIEGEVLLGGATGSALLVELSRALGDCGAKVLASGEAASAAKSVGVRAMAPSAEDPAQTRAKALVFDATGIGSAEQLRELHGFFHPVVRGLQSNGRLIVFGRPPESAGSAQAQIAQRALEGFVRAIAKEIGRKGATAQLVYVAEGAEGAIASTLRFLLSPRSAYVSGQVIRVSEPVAPAAADQEAKFDWDSPLSGKVALVTGAARGIGAAIAETLARDGAHVVGLDVPAAGEDLRRLMERLGGEAIELDITAAEAPAEIAEHFAEGLDVIVHNAGVTRDRTLAKMPEDRWSMVIDINLSSAERINDALLSGGILRPNGRIICVSSIAGIAGNAGQTNYATSKAGVIGMVQALSGDLAAKQHATINAVAPGFIETKMTAAMPFAIREAGRRMNSLLQGGVPQDVAETIAWFASPASSGVRGNVVRVCGQSLLGA